MNYTKEIRDARKAVRLAEKHLKVLESQRRKFVEDIICCTLTERAKKYGMDMEHIQHSLFSKMLLSAPHMTISVTILNHEVKLNCLTELETGEVVDYYNRTIPITYGEGYVINKLKKILEKTYSLECNLKQQENLDKEKLMNLLSKYSL